MVLSEIVTHAALPAQPVLLALQRAAHASAHALSAELAAQDLTGSEINALANLADGHGRTASELAAACGTRPTTLTSVLDRLERRGQVTRGSYPGDRRAVLIELTPDGCRVAAAITAAIAALEGRALAGLHPEAVAAFHTVLRALTEVTAHEPA
jgi:DNA-binding MarR family transcriptional regulator